VAWRLTGGRGPTGEGRGEPHAHAHCSGQRAPGDRRLGGQGRRRTMRQAAKPARSKARRRRPAALGAWDRSRCSRAASRTRLAEQRAGALGRGTGPGRGWRRRHGGWCLAGRLLGFLQSFCSRLCDRISFFGPARPGRWPRWPWAPVRPCS
jgi:hypothetical protein